MIYFLSIYSGENPRFDKPVLVLANPASGKGHAKKLFKEKISPMLQEAYVGYEVLETGEFCCSVKKLCFCLVQYNCFFIVIYLSVAIQNMLR